MMDGLRPLRTKKPQILRCISETDMMPKDGPKDDDPTEPDNRWNSKTRGLETGRPTYHLGCRK